MPKVIKYLPADKFIVFNDGTTIDGELKMDPSIAPITKNLPKPPPPREILGYGLKPEDQYWDAVKPLPPKRLLELIEDREMTKSEKIDLLDSNENYYKEEIEYILWHQRAIREGCWFYNKGKPTPLTHDHVYYLTVWNIEDYHPEFRMRDWEVHWAIKLFCDDDIMCLGINRPKERQIGETNIVCSARLRRASTTPYYKTYMQSKDHNHAKEIHDLLIYQNFINLPFYLQPIWNGDADLVSAIKFFAPKYATREGFNQKALNSIISYRDSSEKSLDGIPQIDLIHNDEIGKVGSDSVVDVYVRWQKQKYCLKQGANKTGFAINTSTVDEMEARGGKQFKQICDESHYNPPIKQSKDYKPRDENGWTVSGLVNIFIPSNEGFLIEEKDSKGNILRRSIDKYGFADLKWTTSYLMRERKALEKSRMEDYLGLLRERPLWWDESFLYNVKDCQFDLAILRERLDQLAYMSPRAWRKGNFYWVDGKQYGKVEWKDDDLNGRWVVSKLLSPQQSNRFDISRGKRYPGGWLEFVAGADPYKPGKKEGSDGGFSVFEKRNFGTDHDEKDTADFKTYNWVCTYSHRHRQIERYVDDAILTCFYYGCKVAEETNVSVLNRDFERLGFGAYLHHFYDENGMQNESAGQDTSNKSKMYYFRYLDDFISKHGMRINHPEIIEDCMAIEHDFGPFDRLVACALSLKAAKEEEEFIPKNILKREEDTTYDDWYAGIPLSSLTTRYN